MFNIPEVLNTLLMGLMFLVILVVLLRPVVLSFMAQREQDEQRDLQKRAIEVVHQHLMRCAEASALQRSAQIRYQKLLHEVPRKTEPVTPPETSPGPSQNKNSKTPDTTFEMLNSAHSYEDKVGAVRRVGQDDQSRVASAIRDMIRHDDD